MQIEQKSWHIGSLCRAHHDAAPAGYQEPAPSAQEPPPSAQEPAAEVPAHETVEPVGREVPIKFVPGPVRGPPTARPPPRPDTWIP